MESVDAFRDTLQFHQKTGLVTINNGGMAGVTTPTAEVLVNECLAPLACSLPTTERFNASSKARAQFENAIAEHSPTQAANRKDRTPSPSNLAPTSSKVQLDVSGLLEYAAKRHAVLIPALEPGQITAGNRAEILALTMLHRLLNEQKVLSQYRRALPRQTTLLLGRDVAENAPSLRL